MFDLIRRLNYLRLNHLGINYLGVTCLGLAFTVASTLPSTSHARVLEEVIVTAQKRVENLQDVPISVSVTTGEKLLEANITTLESMTQYTPNLFVAENPIGNFIFIRGVGSESNQGIEQSVAIFADGIYRGRMQQARAPFLDLARIEVLRGPQSILFGKNTIGGAVNIISAAPTLEWEGSVNAIYTDDFNETEISGYVAGPLTDTLGIRLAARSLESDGFLKNTATGKTDPRRDEETYRAVLEWNPTQQLRITARYEHNVFDVHGRPSQEIGEHPFDLQREVVNDGGDQWVQDGVISAQDQITYDFKSFRGESSLNQMDEGAIRIDYDIGDHTLTAITGYSTYDYSERSDVDFTNKPTIQIHLMEDFKQLSQELRITSPSDREWEYIAGLYWQTASIDFDEWDDFATRVVVPELVNDLLTGGFNLPQPIADLAANVLPTPPNITRYIPFDQDADTLAAFAQTTWHIRDDVRLTLGIRYSHETKDVQQSANYYTLGEGSGPYSCAGRPNLVQDPNDPNRPYILGVNANATPEDLDLAVLCWVNTGYLTTQMIDLGDSLGVDLRGPLTGLISLGTFEHKFTGQRHEAKWTPSINVQYDYNEDTMVYMTVSSGYKGGGYDARILLDSSDQFEFEEETAISSEVGAKTTFPEHAAELNVAFYYLEINDLQVSAFDGYTGFVVGNAAKMRSQGIELDGRWRFADDWTLRGSMAYTDARFLDFPTAGCTAAQFVAYEKAHPGQRGDCLQDLSGSRRFITPEWSSSLTLMYEHELFNAVLFRTALDANFRDNFFMDTDNDPNLVQPAVTIINWRASISGLKERWEAGILVKNATDKLYAIEGSDIPLTDGNYFVITAPPRSVAVQAKLRF